MNRKYRILFGTSYSGNDTTSFLRAYGPFTLMAEHVEIIEPKLTYRKGPSGDLELDMIHGWWNDWRNWRNIDLCFLHRPYGLLGGAIVNAAKMHNVPLWVDHDDDLLAIPETNPHYKIHKESEEKFPGYLYSIKEADVLTCSGKVMHKEFTEKLNRPDAILITTGLDDELQVFKKPFSQNKKIAWRGSTSHYRDIEVYKDGILAIARKYPDLYWYWAGVDPRKVFGDESKIFEGEYSGQRNHYNFLSELCKMNASTHIVPLEDNKFNRVKSNLAWLDATLAGSAVLGPDFQEWENLNIHWYDTTTFAADLEYLMENKKHQKDLHDRSWDYIQKNLMTSKLNEMRYEILSKIGYRKISKPIKE